jgi:UDP-N-acetylglucosamine acyltransferase
MNVHPTAIVHPKAQVAGSVTVGAYARIAENVEIGEGTEVMPHAVIEGHTRIGKNNQIFPFASVGGIPHDLKYRGELAYVEIGDGNIIREFVTIHCGTALGESVTRIGNHNYLMAYVHIAHDCNLGNHIVMANAATLAGHVEIQDYAIVGPFCAIHQFCRVGAHSFMGAFTIATRDVLPFSKTSAPRPLGVYGANRSGLERRGISKKDIQDLDMAFRLLTRSKLNTSQALEAMEAREFKSPHVRKLVEFISTSQRGVAK